MALPLRSLALRQTLTATRIPILRSFSTSHPRHDDNKPNYPFTKPTPASTKGSPTNPASSDTPNYPFTNLKAQENEPSPISPPSRPIETSKTTAQSSSSSTPSGQPIPSSTQTNENRDVEIPHQPDYNVAADYRTSAYSPIPMRVMDGSEEGDVTPAAVLSGAPTELQARTVRIFKPAKTATQSGDWHGHHWQMDWDVLGKGHRWENPLMGWQSSGDYMQATKMNFKTKTDAIRFAEKQGYEYYVQEPNERRFLPKAYATQFVHNPKPLKNIRTK